MAKAKRGSAESPGLDPNSWMVTFSDLLTLLLTFFVLLLTMSSMDKNRLKDLSGSLRGSMGVLEAGQRGEVKGSKLLPHKAQVGQSMVMQLEQAAASIGVGEGEGKGAGLGMSVRRDGDNVLIALPESVLFQPGSASLSSRASGALGAIAKVLKQWPYPVRVQGHADRGGKTPERETLRLSLERALSVVNHLQSRGSIPESRLLAAGFGATRPLDSNLMESGRAKNRRVEIVVVVDPGT
ncbi:MAG: OmpA family protein [Candidatus Tectomicrobia bacterium]|nr:OmpA family protein [Candidatus Tectomicrobia bacterium]